MNRKRCTYDQNGTPYHLHGRKHVCPWCGRRTLQLYLRLEDNEPIGEDVGKCDRHYKCAYNYPPRQFYKDHPEELPPRKNRLVVTQREKRKPLVTIPTKYVIESQIRDITSSGCAFVEILLKLFPTKDVEKVCRLYHLGVTKQGAVIFWQIDQHGLVHEGKAMLYDYATSGRVASSWSTGESKWIFSTLRDRNILPDGSSSTKILFGQHLLHDVDENTNICITESEKNAVFGALTFPDFKWLAVGSTQELSKLHQVKNILARCRSIILVPDADAVKDWDEKKDDFRLGKIKVWKKCQSHAGGFDIADLIRYEWLQMPKKIKAYHYSPTNTSEPPRTAQNERTDIYTAYSPQHRLERIIKRNPAVGEMVQRLELEIVGDDIQPF